MKEFMLGAMYWLNPNYGAKEIEEDMRRIRDNRFNIIRSFIWWEKVEPRKGMREYRQHDMLFDAADKYGLKVMETFGLYLPLWLQKELLAKGIDDRSRRYPCFDRPEVAEPMEEFLRDTVERYKDAPALAIWNLWNEPTNPPCRCPATLKKFCLWLKRKYLTIEELKAAWLGEFQVFTTACVDSLDELTPEWLADAFEFGTRGRITPMESDWHAFTFDNARENIIWLRDTVRSIDPVHETHANPATPLSNSLHCGLNEWALAREMESISISVHPSHHFFSHDVPENFSSAYLYCIDEVRSWAQGKDAWIGELQAGTTLYHARYYTPSPEEITHTLYHALGRGLHGVLFWEWQAWRSSMMEVGEFSLRRAQDGAPTERSEAAKRFALDVERHHEVLAEVERPSAEVAIFASMAARNFKFQQFRNKPHIPGICDEHNDAVYGCYKALNRANIAVDFITELTLDTLKRYKVLFVPQVEMVSREVAQILRQFVADGGALWADGRCGWLDDHVYLRSTVPGNGLAELFGCCEEDFVAFPEPVRLAKARSYRHLQYLHPTTGEELARTGRHVTAVRNQFGQGETELWGSYVTLGLQREGEDADTMDQISDFAFRHGVRPVVETTPPQALECSRLAGERADLFVIGNRRHEPCTVELSFPDSYREFGTAGQSQPGGSRLTLALGARETRIVIGRK